VKYPWLTERAIETEAEILLAAVFKAPRGFSCLVNLDEIVIYLSERDRLSYDDEADLPQIHGQAVLGKTQPLSRRILLSRDLKLDAEPGRGRFTLAHELGHWILHRPLCVAQAQELSLFAADPQTIEFVGLESEIFPLTSSHRVQPEEWQANYFAVALLIDPALLRLEFTRRFQAPPLARSESRLGHAPTLRDHAARPRAVDRESSR
jgi:hypothetical protein